MVEIAGSIYVAATAAFVLSAAAVGVRLIGLYRRTHQAPEGLLGWGLLLTGGLGYGLMIFSILSDQAAVSAGRASDAQAAVSCIGWVLHNIGVLLMLRFLVTVYRPDSRAARPLAIGLADPLVCNRFLLWTLASVSALGSIWIVNVPSLVRAFTAEADISGLTVVSLLVTAVFGLGTVSLYWLTFFPPTWYRDRILAASSASHA